MEPLTDEQKVGVQRLLHLHYVRGVIDSAKSLSETFDELGANDVVAIEALTNLLKWAEEQVSEAEAESEAEKEEVASE